MNKRHKVKKESPKIYRLFPESFRNHLLDLNRRKIFSVYRKSLKVFTVFIFIVAIIYLGIDLYNNTQEKKRVDVERERITKELNFWKSFISEHKDYRDAYFQAAILEYELGNKDLAKSYLKQGLALDPNSEKGRSIEKILTKFDK